MSMKPPNTPPDATQPFGQLNSPQPAPPSSSRSVAVAGVLAAFALVALVMLGIGYVAGRAANTSNNTQAAPIVMQPPNADAARQTEAASYTNLVTQNALFSEQVGAAQRNFATADARLRELGPALDAAAATISAHAAEATTPPTDIASTAATTSTNIAGPIVTLAVSANTPIQGLLPGETTIATTANTPYRFRVQISPFTVADTLPNCGRIEGSISPALTDSNEDFRVEWRHTTRAESTTVWTRGGANGPGRFSIAVPPNLANGVFLIEVYNDNGVAVAPVATVRFPADCTGYRLQLTYTETTD